MEADIIVSVFMSSMETHRIKYTVLVGDGESSVHAKLLQKQTYGLDRNHLLTVS